MLPLTLPHLSKRHSAVSTAASPLALPPHVRMSGQSLAVPLEVAASISQ